MSGIYLHIPFCKQACSYCDFYFVTRTAQRENFVDRLVREIRSYRNTQYVEEPVRTIYFGGGTPSLLDPSQVGRILDALSDTFEVVPDEVTFEMNPDDVTADYLQALLQLGIDRASMGVQSFNPELLDIMNRAHTREEALRCVDLLGKSGFQTFTVDLIYGNPGQSLEELEEDVDQLLEFNPHHVSAYSLTIESGTRLGKQVRLGRIIPPEDDRVADHFDLINRKFAGRGIYRYEVSNYCRPGHEAVHNSNYWRHKNYLGFGPGAHSFWWDDEAIRWQNKSNLAAYLSVDTSEMRTGEEVLTLNQLAEERLMMGLRTKEGVSTGELEKTYDYIFDERQLGYLERKEREGLVALDGRLRFTDEGVKIADAIILDLLTLK